MRKTGPVAAVVLAVLLAVGITGCTNGAGSSAAGGVAMSGNDSGRAPAASGTTADGSGRTVTKASDTRSVVLTGSLALAAKDPVAVAQRIGSIVAGGGGHLDSDDEQPGRAAHADLVARIPSDAFTTTLAAIERTATVRSVSLHSSDVTAQVIDYAVRIGALEASVARLRTLLGRASDTSDLVSLESALTSRESDLESLQAQQRGLAGQVSFASLTIGVVLPAASPPPVRVGTFASGFAAGWTALAVSAAWAAVALGALAPWVVVLGAVAGAVLLVQRVRRRRRRASVP